jgi:hypothetical protein
MAKKNKSPFIKLDKDDFEWWAYDFNFEKKRYRGKIAPYVALTRSQAAAKFKMIKVQIIMDAISS